MNFTAGPRCWRFLTGGGKEAAAFLLSVRGTCQEGQSWELVGFQPHHGRGSSWEPCVKSEVLELGQGRSNAVGRQRVDGGVRAGTQARWGVVWCGVTGACVAWRGEGASRGLRKLLKT